MDRTPRSLTLKLVRQRTRLLLRVGGLSLYIGLSACAQLPIYTADGVVSTKAEHTTRQEPTLEISTSPVISLDGQWQFKPGNFSGAGEYLEHQDLDRDNPTLVNDNDWQTIPVPSNWFLAGQDIAGVAWYRKPFDMPNELLDKQLMLHFEGVDYMADVWLNGEYLGFHSGYFQAFSFDISNQVRSDNNQLVVRVNSPLENPGQSWSLRKRLIKGVLGHHDTRPGGAWSERGQEKNTGGIWAPVSIRVSDKIAINTVKFRPFIDGKTQISEGIITLSVNRKKNSDGKIIGNNNGEQIDVELTLSRSNDPDSSELYRQSFMLTADQQKIQLVIPKKKRALWWPWEMGNPNLYHAEIRIMQGDRLLDTWQEFIGFRSVRIDPQSGEWFINGNRIFIRGTNYIATQWLSEMNSAAYAKDLDLMKDAHINAVRVHAHLLGKQFYRQADRAGMLIWQDFPLQWGYVDTETFIQECERQAEAMVEQFYNFPSIVVWSGHNEPPWDATWMTYKYSDYQAEQNRVLDKRVYETISRLDDSRYVHKYSSTNEHPWFGWYSGHWKDYATPTKEPLITEFGAQALPSIENLSRIVGKQNLWPETKKQRQRWEYHNFQFRETFEIAKVKKGETTQELIDNTQFYQARLIKFAAESYRRQRYQPVGGIFQFMFVEDWPSMNWGVLDYWRQPKPAYESLKTAYQPILPSIAWKAQSYKHDEITQFSLWVVNDLDDIIEQGVFRYELFFGGNSIEQINYPLNVAGDSVQRIATVKKQLSRVGDYRVNAVIVDKTGQVLGRNSYEFSVQE